MNYLCIECSREFPVESAIFRCDCGGPLAVAGYSMFSRKALENRGSSIWRYREAFGLPEAVQPVSLGEGFSPVIKREIEGIPVRFKLDYLQPTGSFKDRGASVLVSLVKYLGIESLVEDSSGNAGASIAAYSASAGIRCKIFVPDYTPSGKLSQMKLLGAEVVRIKGTRQDTNDAVIEESKSSYYASHLWNPYFAMGAKSAAFEIWEQFEGRMGRMRRMNKMPSSVIVPVGSGGYLEGIYLGFKDLVEAGYMKSMPELIGVQAENCPAVHLAFTRGESISLESITATVAEGIAVSEPPRLQVVLKAIRESGGKTITVTEEEILDSLKMLFSMGIFVEPTSAVTLAGWFKLSHEEKTDTILMLTGIGLKETVKLEELFLR